MRTDDLILNAIERIISVKLNKFENMDYKAIVVGEDNNNKYKIKYNGQIYSVENCTAMTFKAGDTVWVHKPNGNDTNQYIIASSCGTIKR